MTIFGRKSGFKADMIVSKAIDGLEQGQKSDSSRHLHKQTKQTSQQRKCHFEYRSFGLGLFVQMANQSSHRLVIEKKKCETAGTLETGVMTTSLQCVQMDYVGGEK